MHARLNPSLSPAQGYQKRKCWTACNYPWPEPAASAILSCISNCSENLQQKTFNSGILQSCTFQDLILGRLMAFLGEFLSNFFSPSLKAHWFPLLALGKVSDGAERLHVHCKLRKRMVLQLGSWPSFGELSIREPRTRPILYVGGVFPSPVSKS